VGVGAMSPAPYGRGGVSESAEADRLGWAGERLVSKLGATVPADPRRAAPARAALHAGARIVNDVSGLTADPGVAALVAARGAGLILMASPRGAETATSRPIASVRALLEQTLRIPPTAG